MVFTNVTIRDLRNLFLFRWKNKLINLVRVLNPDKVERWWKLGRWDFFLWKIAVLLIFKQIVEEAKPRVKDYLLLFIFIFWVDEYFIFAEVIVFYLVIRQDKKNWNEKPDLNEGMSRDQP